MGKVATPPLMAFALYLDDDAGDRALTEAFRARGFDVLRAVDAGMRGAADAAHLQFASKSHRAVVSANRGDFMRLHVESLSAGQHHSGIVLLLQQRWTIGGQVRRFESLLESLSPDDMRDRLEFLSNWPPS